MAIISTITAEGFGSYRKKQTLTLNGQGAVAILGENGAGKSTIVSKALTWCLYGKCPPERMGSGTRAISGKSVVSTGLKKAKVEVEILAGADPFLKIDNHEEPELTTWRIVRSRGRTGKDAVEIYRDEESVVEATQATIDGIVGANYETFCRTVVRGQGDPWSFAEATDSRKREILDSISGADELEAAFSKAKKSANEASVTFRDAERRSTDLKLQLSRNEVERSTEFLNTWRESHASKIEDAKATLKAIRRKLEGAKSEDAKIDDNLKLLKNLKANAPQLDMSPYRKAVEASAEDFREAFGKFEATRQTVDRLKSLSFGDPCPTCNTPIGQSVVKTLSKEETRLAHLSQELSEARGHSEECKRTEKDAALWLQEETTVWRNKLVEVPSATPQAPALARELVHVQKRLTDLMAVENPYQSRLALEVKRRGELERELSVAEASAQSARWVIDAAEAWQEALGPKGVRAHMAEATLSAIEIAANHWLSILSDKEIVVEFPATREVRGRVKEEIKTVIHIEDDGQTTTRDILTLSGGERRRINLAVDLGVSAACEKGGLSLSLLVLDEEVFSGMDEHGKAAVVEALHGAGVSDVVIIDHDPRLSAVLPRTILVTKTKGYSVIREIKNEG